MRLGFCAIGAALVCVPAAIGILPQQAWADPYEALAKYQFGQSREPLASIEAEIRKTPASGYKAIESQLLAGLIGSIGVCRDAKAVEPLSRLARDADPLIAGDALSALGEIATDEAVRVLEGIWPPEPLKRVKAQAKITAAGRLAAAGKRSEAVKLYGTLIGRHPQAVRIAAVKGIMSTAPRDIAVREMYLFLSRPNEGDEKWMRAAAIAAYLGSTDKAMKDAVAEQLPTMNPDGQRALLLALADAPDVTARPAVLKVLNATGYADVRVAAVECLARHGEAADVPLVVRLAHAKREDVADAARKVLQRMGKPGVDEALARLIESSDAADRAVVLAVLADRRVEAALPILVRLLGGSDAAMAAEAAKGLGVLGKNEQLTALAGVLVRPQSDSVCGAAEEAVKAICARSTDKKAAAKALLAAMDKAATPAGRSAVLRLLAHTRGDEALSAVRKTIEDPNEEVRETAVRTLIAWPEAAAAPYLVELAKTAQKPVHAVLALRDGCLRLANLKEVSCAKAEWRPAIVPPGGRPGLVEMDKLLGGNNRVCYLKTQIASAKDQDTLLEIGSDDGVKVWLNGRVVHANNAIRPCTPDQDKAKMRLKQGMNTLLLKITQGGGEWTVCCRLRSPDGKPLAGVTVAPGEP